MNKKHAFLIALLVGLGVAGASFSFFNQAKQKQIKQAEQQAAVKDLQNKLENIKQSVNSAQPIKQSTDDTQKASGEFGKLEKFTKDFMNEGIALQNDYMKELETIGWMGVLDPNRIKADTSQNEGKEIIAKIKAIIPEYKNKQYALLDGAKDKINRLDISESTKKGVLEGYNNTVANGKENITKLYDLEMQIVELIEKSLILLQTNPDAWMAENNQATFLDETLLKEYNGYMSDVTKLSAEQERIQLQSINNAKNSFNKLK